MSQPDVFIVGQVDGTPGYCVASTADTVTLADVLGWLRAGIRLSVSTDAAAVREQLTRYFEGARS